MIAHHIERLKFYRKLSVLTELLEYYKEGLVYKWDYSHWTLIHSANTLLKFNGAYGQNDVMPIGGICEALALLSADRGMDTNTYVDITKWLRDHMVRYTKGKYLDAGYAFKSPVASSIKLIEESRSERIDFLKHLIVLVNGGNDEEKLDKFNKEYHYMKFIVDDEYDKDMNIDFGSDLS